MRNWYWWLVGGGLTLWAFNAFAQNTPRVGNLAVTVTFRAGGLSLASANTVLNAMLGMRQVCTGAPPIQSAVQAPAVSGNSIVVVFAATWTHDTMGPVRETVRKCYLDHLQALDKNVIDVRAERVS